MLCINQFALESAVKFWLQTCNKLGVDITAPYVIEVDGKTVKYLAFLPDYGGAKGTVICPMDLPKVGPDENLRKIARLKGFFVSSINVSPYAKGNVNEKVFQEMLEDWGYYGSEEKRPSWFEKLI